MLKFHLVAVWFEGESELPFFSPVDYNDIKLQDGKDYVKLCTHRGQGKACIAWSEGSVLVSIKHNSLYYF